MTGYDLAPDHKAAEKGSKSPLMVEGRNVETARNCTEKALKTRKRGTSEHMYIIGRARRAHQSRLETGTTTTVYKRELESDVDQNGNRGSLALALKRWRKLAGKQGEGA